VAITKDVTLHHASEIVEKKLDAIEQLQKINEYANELLDLQPPCRRVGIPKVTSKVNCLTN
jgi:hypothetical protein